jgi:hypothetical protein
LGEEQYVSDPPHYTFKVRLWRSQRLRYRSMRLLIRLRHSERLRYRFARQIVMILPLMVVLYALIAFTR